jgi:hypothetical protein
VHRYTCLKVGSASTAEEPGLHKDFPLRIEKAVGFGMVGNARRFVGPKIHTTGTCGAHAPAQWDSNSFLKAYGTV